MNPYSAEDIAWDEGNESELAAHQIRPTEVMEVWDDEQLVFAPNKKNRAGNFKMIGSTYGGRVLTIVVHYDGEARILRPITGWNSTTGELTRYR